MTRLLSNIIIRRKLVLLAAAAILLLLLSGDWKADPDSVNYLSMARSLAMRHQLLRFSSRQWFYAPLYAIVISPAFWLSSRPFWVISEINVATAILLMLGVYFWFFRYAKNGAVLIAALVAVNIGLWDVVREPRADALFSALLIWAAFALEQIIHARKFSRWFGWTLIASALVIATCLTRQVGVFLVAGFAVAVLFRARNRRGFIAVAIIGFAAFVTVAGLMIHEHRAAEAGSVTYLNQFRQPDISLAAQLAEGIRRQIADFGRLLIPGMWGSFAHQGQWLNINTIIYTVFAVPILWGWQRLARRTLDPLICSLPFYCAMFIIWPFDQGTRFTVPMLPVLWAIVWFLLRSWPRQRIVILLMILGIHVIISLGYLVRDAKIIHTQNRDWAAMSELAAAIPDDVAVAATDLPQHRRLMLMYLLDRRMTPANDRKVDWVFTPAYQPIPPNFKAITVAGQTCLSHRQP